MAQVCGPHRLFHVIGLCSMSATIFALSSGQDRAGVAVIRVSGPGASPALRAIARVVPGPRVARRVRLIDPADGLPLDDALALWFPGPQSFTGEDVAELHVHGGRAVVAGVLAALGRLPGLRLAEPGEFTRRAFEHGKIDLTEAEGLADLIAAETDAQRCLALRQLSGELHRAAEAWRRELLQAQALVEAAIDFADEGDVSGQAVCQAAVIGGQIAQEIKRTLDDDYKGEILRDGFRVVIAGPPNVGKSSLINAIARRDAAIVSDEAGTTRDIVELQLNLAGLAVVLADTAGMRAAEGKIEREGIRRGLERARAADLLLWVMDATAPDEILPPELAHAGVQVLWVLNKIDLANSVVTGNGGKIIPDAWVSVSTLTGGGIAELEAQIAHAARERTRGGEAALITTARHRQHIAAAAAALVTFEAGAKNDLELRAEDLRQAADSIGRLVGRIGAEEILGEIFGRFCIGK